MSLVRLLGPVDVVGDDGVVHNLGSTLRRTMLALLAIRPGQVVSSDWLMEHVWGDDLPASGLRALRFHISRLRNEIGAVVPIETRPGGYRLNVSRDSVDALIFDDQSHLARVEADDERAAALCVEALGLWRGEPFVDAAACTTLENEAARLVELRVTTIEQYHSRRLAGEGGSELIADLTQLVKEHPLREALWSSLIVAQYRAGQQAEALRTYERLRANLAESLGLDPSPELQDLQIRVLRQDPGLSPDPAHRAASARNVAACAHNLPALATSFIDPTDGIAAARALMHAHRLVTLTGPAGVGKTRMAIEVGMASLGEFHEEVRFVELAAVIEADAVVAAMAAALSVIPQAGATTLESVIDWCHGRRCLVIIDNCEHVIDVAGEAVAAIIARCPTVKIIATSREALGLVGEWVHQVTSLDRDTAIQLFAERATASDSTFVLADSDSETVATLCERLDGVPLAIELAAGRARSMTPEELLLRLDDRFRLLRGTARGRHDRHQTLRAAVQWSYQLLGADERVVFERISVFTGSYDAAAAEAVCQDEMIDRREVVDVLSYLVDKSIIVAERHTGATRYRLLETLREFGLEQLRLRGDDEGPSERHLLHYVDVAAEADRLFRGPREADGQRMFESEWDNLRAAFTRAINTGDLDHAESIIASAWVYAKSRMRFEIGEWAERALAIESVSRSARPETFGQASLWAAVAGQEILATARAKQGLDRAPTPDHPSTALCWALLYDRDLPHETALEPPHEVVRPTDSLQRFEAASVGLDLDYDWWALVQLVEQTGDRANSGSNDGSDPSGHGQHRGRPAEERWRRHLARLIETANRVASPSLQATSALYQAHGLIDRTPPDIEHALAGYLRALAIARQVGNMSVEGDSIRAVALATTYLCADKHAAQACRTALTRLYEIRSWETLWQTMESVALVLASNLHTEEATIVLGHLEAFHPPSGREARFGFRKRALDLVHRDAHADQWMECGAATDRDRIILEAIDYLGTINQEA